MKSISALLLIFSFITIYYSQAVQPPGTIPFSSVIGRVDFLHNAHSKDFDVKCSYCHHQTVAGTERIPHKFIFQKNWKKCILCHRTGGKKGQIYKCSICHNGQAINKADKFFSPKVVIHKKCFECHDLGTGLEAYKKCKFCHTGPRKKLLKNY